MKKILLSLVISVMASSVLAAISSTTPSIGDAEVAAATGSALAASAVPPADESAPSAAAAGAGAGGHTTIADPEDEAGAGTTSASSPTEQQLEAMNDPLIKVASEYFRNKDEWTSRGISDEVYRRRYDDSNLELLIEILKRDLRNMEHALDRNTEDKYKDYKRKNRSADPEAITKQQDQEYIENVRIIGGLLVMCADTRGMFGDAFHYTGDWFMADEHWKPVCLPMASSSSAPAAAGAGASSAGAGSAPPAQLPLTPECAILMTQLMETVPISETFLRDFRHMGAFHALIFRQSYWHCITLEGIAVSHRIKTLQDALDAKPALQCEDVAESILKIREIETLLPKHTEYKRKIEKLEAEIRALQEPHPASGAAAAASAPSMGGAGTSAPSPAPAAGAGATRNGRETLATRPYTEPSGDWQALTFREAAARFAARAAAAASAAPAGGTGTSASPASASGTGGGAGAAE